MRMIVDLPEAQINALGELCRAQGISRTEAVRGALAEMLAGRKEMGREKAFGAWSARKIDGREHLQTLREEWGE